MVHENYADKDDTTTDTGAYPGARWSHAGTMIQQYNLSEADFRGERLRIFPGN